MNTLINNHASSFILSVTGDSMIGEGIKEKRSGYCGARPGTQKRRHNSGGSRWQLDNEVFSQKRKKGDFGSGQPKYPPISPQEELRIAGVITAVVRKIP